MQQEIISEKKHQLKCNTTWILDKVGPAGCDY